MYTDYSAREEIDQRGPRWAVWGRIRKGESRTQYADTAEQAEQVRQSFENPADWGYRDVKVYPPTGSVDLTALGRARAEAQRAFNDATEILRAGVLRALEDGRAEAEVARSAGIDRMTVRKWAGK